MFFDEQSSLLNAISQFHRSRERLSITRGNIAAGPGSSSFLAAISLWLVGQGFTELFYVPPLYYTFHFFLQLLGIRARPVSGHQAFEPGFTMNLPTRKTALLLTDPIWYAGKRFPADAIARIQKWQQSTDSLVVVDGSFQYMQWDGERYETSSTLDTEHTFRLLCPTKSLAIPFFRFAYVLHPTRFHDDFLFTYESIVGGTNIFDVGFAKRAFEVLLSREGNRPLTDYLSAVYRGLRERRLIKTSVEPECGYFAFAIPQFPLPPSISMDEDYFELKRFPEYLRINLMKAATMLGH